MLFYRWIPAQGRKLDSTTPKWFLSNSESLFFIPQAAGFFKTPGCRNSRIAMWVWKVIFGEVDTERCLFKKTSWFCADRSTQRNEVEASPINCPPVIATSAPYLGTHGPPSPSRFSRLTPLWRSQSWGSSSCLCSKLPQTPTFPIAANGQHSLVSDI